MILVNNPGTWQHVYAPLRHARWNGCTLADLIFPFFLFIIGIAITLSFQRRRDAGASRRRLYIEIARRSVLIFALGIFLNGFPLFDWSVLRVPGVLQRIAVCYACAAVIVLNSGVRGQSLVAAALVVGYWIALVWVPVPGAPGGPFAPEGNLAAYLDTALLPGHLLHDGSDPEGLLSTLPALATTLTGVLAGQWIRSPRPAHERVTGLIAAGLIGVVLGRVASHWCPINKSLWTSSYVLFSGGAALCALAVCYWLIDVQGYRRWARPFVVYGRNPIVAYVLSSVVAKEMLLWRVARPDGSTLDLQRYLFETIFTPLAQPNSASLLYAVMYVLVWLAVATLLYRRGVLIKI